MSEASPADEDRPGGEHALSALPTERVALAAYLGYRPARELLGAASPAMFSLYSMQGGGDRHWRKAMRALGHESAAVAACAIAELALGAYLTAPDAPREAAALAKDVVGALQSWSREKQSGLCLADMKEKCEKFFLAVMVDGRLWKPSRYRAEWLGEVIGKCYSVVLSPETGLHVRWLGEAAMMTRRHLDVPAATVRQAVADVLLDYALLVRTATAKPESG